MTKRVFISYCHKQGKWVRDKLVPCLKAGGAEALIDLERFEAGKPVVGQMDHLQDGADISLLVLSPDYLVSDNCAHEMRRALAADPGFLKGLVVPVMRVDCALPDEIKKPDLLYVDLRDDKKADQWSLLLKACVADLGASAPDWLDARTETVRYLGRGESVNLVVKRSKNAKPLWNELIMHIQTDFLPDLGVVDLNSGSTTSRRGLVAEILKACGSMVKAPPESDELVFLDRVLVEHAGPVLMAMVHFDMVAYRDKTYGMDFFSALRDLVAEKRKLILLIQSRSHFNELLPADHPLSSITNLKTVELKGKP